MKAGNHGCGPRGWLMLVVAAVMVVAGALFLGGCGDDEQKAVAEVQEDSNTISPKEEEIRDITDVDGGEEVLPGYSANQCLEEMTARYGSADTAAQVCNTIRTENGTASVAQLSQIVPQIEQQLGVTPLPGSPPPGSGAGNNTNTNTTPDSVVEQPGGGWDSGGIEITVPPAP